MITGQTMEMALGLPVLVDSFGDRVPRYCFPFTIQNLSRIITYLGLIDPDSLLENIKDEERLEFLLRLLSESFQKNEPEDVLKNITEERFPELIQDIKLINGVSDKNGERDLQSEQTALGFDESIYALQTYTSNTYKDIRDMTLVQLSGLLEAIGKKINWEYKTGILDLVSEPNDFIDSDEYPLAPKQEKKKMVTMQDLMGLRADN